MKTRKRIRDYNRYEYGENSSRSTHHQTTRDEKRETNKTRENKFFCSIQHNKLFSWCYYYFLLALYYNYCLRCNSNDPYHLFSLFPRNSGIGVLAFVPPTSAIHHQSTSLPSFSLQDEERQQRKRSGSTTSGQYFNYNQKGSSLSLGQQKIWHHVRPLLAAKKPQQLQDIGFLSNATLDTSLCIIPPDYAWDDIQRARHLARDPTFYQFPPSIRLFHPFLPRSDIPEAAMDLAKIIESYDLEGFEITLDQILILPHLELLEELERAHTLLPKQDDDGSSHDDKLTEEERKTQRLIEMEEAKGKKKMARRKAKEMEKQRLLRQEANGVNDAQGGTTSDGITDGSGDGEHLDYGENNKDLSPRQLLKQQAKQKSEFNGPCVICLEPNEESKIQIMAFREVLRKKLFTDFDPFSVSSALSHTRTSIINHDGIQTNGLPNAVLRKHGLLPEKKGSKGGMKSNRSPARRKKEREGSTFRPVLTLGRFSSVSKAVKVARTLQQVWEPLTFQVSDLQFISRSAEGLSKTTLLEGKDELAEHKTDINTMWSKYDDVRHSNVDGNNNGAYGVETNKDGTPILSDNREYALRKLHGTDESESLLTTSGEYGCDALVILKGEEGFSNTDKEVDNKEINEDSDLGPEEEGQLLNLLMSDAGIAGGADQSEQVEGNIDNPALRALERSAGQMNEDADEGSNLEDWLKDDEDWDEGATIVIGRTHFFLGEMRQYVGMPASSTMDGKDRILGDGVSGSARRRGAVHRQGDRYDDGDFGRKDKDYRA